MSENGVSPRSANPIFPGYYADPEARIFGHRYWVYPTVSAPYEEELYFDAFSSADLVNWEKHPRILDNLRIRWAHRAVWAPSPIEKDGKYYIYFAANDIKSENEVGGLGVAVSDRPEGPFEDCLGEPLLNRFINGAQPIDPHVFRDTDDTDYLFYGGWRHCNVAILGKDMKTLLPCPGGDPFPEVTPEGYVEAPCMVKRGEWYYFMWAEENWMGPLYRVAYARSRSPLGPFARIGVILEQDPAVATGAGHHTVLQIPGTDDWYVFYHRRPLGDTNPHHRVVCMERLEFDDTGYIRAIKLTNGSFPPAPCP